LSQEEIDRIINSVK